MPGKKKPRNAHALELRRGNRTTPIPSGKTYRRRPKHTGREH